MQPLNERAGCTIKSQFYLCVVVRKNNFHIALLCLLGVGLLFNQVGLNFFHDKHNAHKSYSIQNDQAQFHHHGEHCKVCATDTLFHLYIEVAPLFYLYQPERVEYSIAVITRVTPSPSFVKGRAPPTLI